MLKTGDIVVGLNRPITCGELKIAKVTKEYNNSMLYQRAGRISYKIECDENFSYYILSNELLKFTLREAVGSDQPFISTSKLDEWEIKIPSNIEEQKKIGNFLTNLDNLIALQKRECEKYKELKKGLLQQMFV